MKNFDKINQHNLISILWILCHLHSSNLTLMPIKKKTIVHSQKELFNTSEQTLSLFEGRI